MAPDCLGYLLPLTPPYVSARLPAVLEPLAPGTFHGIPLVQLRGNLFTPSPNSITSPGGPAAPSFSVAHAML